MLGKRLKSKTPGGRSNFTFFSTKQVGELKLARPTLKTEAMWGVPNFSVTPDPLDGRAFWAIPDPAMATEW